MRFHVRISKAVVDSDMPLIQQSRNSLGSSDSALLCALMLSNVCNVGLSTEVDRFPHLVFISLNEMYLLAHRYELATIVYPCFESAV